MSVYEAEPGSMMATFGSVLPADATPHAGGRKKGAGGRTDVTGKDSRTGKESGPGNGHNGRKHGFKKAAVLIAVILIPLVYSYFFLDAFMDPYSHLGDLPVALVNTDEGAVIDGADRNVGREVADRLVEDHSLNWVLTDANDAANGLNNRRYYAEVYIPTDFSASIAAVDGTDRIQARIEYRPNEKRNYLASQILSRAILQVKTEVAGTLTKEITDRMVVEFEKIPGQLTELADGLGQMQDGTGQLLDGTEQLTDGQRTFNGKLGELRTGLDSLAAGTGTLTEKLGTFSDGQRQFSDGIDRFGSGLATAAGGARSLKENLARFDEGQKKFQDGLILLQGGFSDALGGSGALKDGSAKLRDGQKAYQDGVVSLGSGLSKAKDGSVKLADGANALAAGLTDFNTALTAGAGKAGELVSGSTAIKAGLAQASAGASTLSASYTTFDQGVSGLNTLYATYSTMVEPKTGVDPTTYATVQAQLQGTVATLAAKSPEIKAGLSGLSGAAGLAGLNAGYGQLDAGIQTLAGSVSTAATKSALLKQGAADLSTGAKALDEGIGSALNGSAQLITSGNELLSGQQTLAAGAESLSGGLVRAGEGLDTLAAKGAELSDASGKLAQGGADLDAGMRKLTEGQAELDRNMARLTDGGQQLAAGAAVIYDGAAKAADGSGKLLAAGGDLLAGEEDLAAGVTELQDGIVTARTEVDDNIATARDKVAGLQGLGDYVKDPVAIDEERVNPVPNYGSAFAPYFMSLSMWVGALMMYFGLYMDRSMRFRHRRSKLYISEFWKYALVGVVQAVLLGIVLERGLQLQVRSETAFYAACLVVSLTFVSIMQFLIVHLKDVGKFLAILVLILQLTSCGGTFPMELVPGFFNVINPFMPMTYSVNAFKEAISGVDWNYLYWNLLVLGTLFVAFQAASFAMFHIKRRRKPDEANGGGHPERDGEGTPMPVHAAVAEGVED